MATPDRSADGALVSLEALYLERGRIEQARVAPQTEFGYGFDWRAFTRWCGARDLCPLPAAAETVLLFATEMLTRGNKTSTVRRLASGIAYTHRKDGLPVDWMPQLVLLLAGARAERARRQNVETLEQAIPLSVEDLRLVSRHLAGENTTYSIRDRAILVVGFATALRSASLVDLQLADLEFEPRGCVVHVRREKNDQLALGRMIGLTPGKHQETCPIGCLREWLAIRGDFPGPVFTHISRKGAAIDHGLVPERINIVVQKSLQKVGLYRPGHSSHSLRAGCVTAAAEAGASALVIAQTSGHRNLAMVRRYFRRRDAFAATLSEFLDL